MWRLYILNCTLLSWVLKPTSSTLLVNKILFSAQPQALFLPSEQGSKTAVLPSPGLFQAAAITHLPRMENPALPPPMPALRAGPPTQNPQNNAQRTTLWAAVKKKAQSNGDILAILEARDKLLRLGSAKSTVASAIKTLGSCNDMCPEKER